MTRVLSFGKAASRDQLLAFLRGKRRVAFASGGQSHKLCGAEEYFSSVLRESSAEIIPVGVSGSDPKVETVQPLLDLVKGGVDAFISVGGGTVIDTAKILNLAYTAGVPVKTLLESNAQPSLLLPHMAFPTTAGTGAEATRFAVCYDGETKYSIDVEKIRPTNIGLIPEFTYSLPQYQTAATGFDAFAQATESLWAKGATDESRTFARRALDRLAYLEEAVFSPSPDSRREMQIGAYEAGCAIDISRTTAAHAFSYYMSAVHRIPHGHAVAMMFPYILRANASVLSAYPEIDPARILALLKRLEAAGMESLPQFAARNNIPWTKLVDDLFAHVNLKRLGNNPCEVRKEAFNE